MNIEERERSLVGVYESVMRKQDGVVIEEKKEDGTVKTNLKVGKPAAGDLGKAKGTGPEASDAEKPKEGDKSINPFRKKSKDGVCKEGAKKMDGSQFNQIFAQHMLKENGPDEFGSDSNAGDDFAAGAGSPDDAGNIEGDETSDEVDVATKLRMIIDELTDIAESLGAFDDEEGGEGEMGEGEMGDEFAANPPPVGEATQVKSSPLKNGVPLLTSRKNIVNSKFKGKGGTAACKGSKVVQSPATPAKKSTLGPKSPMTVKANSPMGHKGADLF